MSDKPLPRSPRELVSAYFDALNAGNIEDVVSLFWGDAVFSTTPDQTLTGKSLISSYYFELLKSRLPDAHFRLIDYEDDPDKALARFTWSAENKDNLVQDGNDLFQYERSDDAVLIRRYEHSHFTIKAKPTPIVIPPGTRVVKTSDKPPVTQTNIPAEPPITSEAPPQPPQEQKIETGSPAGAEPTERDFAGSAVNDRPEGKDQLGYDDYARAFAGVLDNFNTITPLTIGIYGSWGIGKSFLMKRLRYFLQKAQKSRDAKRRKLSWGRRLVNWLALFLPVLPPAPEPEEGEQPTLGQRFKQSLRQLARPFTRPPSTEVEFLFVDFNAWVYSGSENLWAGLITKLYREIESFFGWRAVYFRLYHNLRASLLRKIGPLIVLGLLVSLLLNYQQVVDTLNQLNDAIRVLVATVATLASFAIIPQLLTSLPDLIKAVREFISALFLARSDQLTTLSSRKDFREKIGFMADIKDEISFLGKLLRPEWNGRLTRIVIFIDDLDRCPPAKAVEVLEAIILLLSDENKMPFVMVLGLDARIIVKAVEERYGKVLTEAGITGYEYLDKIVQIPFRIPPAGPLEIEKYVESLIYRSEAEKTQAQELIGKLAADKKIARLWREVDTLQTDIISASGLNATETVSQLKQLEAARNLALNNRDRLAEAEKIVTTIRERLSRPADKAAPVAPEPIFKPEEADTIKQFARSEWLSRNPRRIKRIINVYRISRSLDPDASTAHRQKLIKWIVLSEQWPYRTAWMMQCIEDDEQLEKKLAGDTTLQTVFAGVRADVNAKDAQPFATLEDGELFDSFIDDKNQPTLTVADARTLRRYTFNLNPALQEEVQKAAARKKGEPAKPQTTVVKLESPLENDLREVLKRLQSNA